MSSVFQPYRSAFHFQPSNNWMNDPNGPMVYNGIYHFFYQWSPEGADWIKTIVWGHATSTDLVNWNEHEPAIEPSQPFDVNGCWSGSVTILHDGRPVILYTGADKNDQQLQNLAMPKDLSDPYLIEWVKSPLNPLMTPPASENILPDSFRDPTTAWLGPDGKWRVIIGSCRDKMGIALLYTSEDFLHWEKTDQPLHSAKDTGMWECPDLFPVSTCTPAGMDPSTPGGADVKHVLKLSLFDTFKEYYTIGIYDPHKDIYVPDEGSVENDSGLRLDYGRFYASKTFFDSVKKRRVLWGWVHESSSTDDYIKRGWAGLQAVPRTVWLDELGKQLLQWPIEELETLREGRVDLSDKLLQSGTKMEVVGVTASQADVEVVFDLPELDRAEVFDPSWTEPLELCIVKGASAKGGIGPFGLMVLASKELEEYTSIFFRIFKDKDNKYVVFMGSDQSRSSLNDNNTKTNYGTFVDIDPCQQKLSLRILIDRSIVEAYGGGGKACITSRVYPTVAVEDEAHLYAFNYGAADVGIVKLSAWSMKKAQIN